VPVARIVPGHDDPGVTGARQRAAQRRVGLKGDRKVAVPGERAQAPHHAREIGRAGLAQPGHLHRVRHLVFTIHGGQRGDDDIMAQRLTYFGPQHGLALGTAKAQVVGDDRDPHWED
jgi:hypothetical protein